MKGEGGRSWSSSASSLFSQGTQPESPTASMPDEGSDGSSASEDDSESNGKSKVGSNDRESDSGGSSDDESSSSSESGSGEASDDEGTQQGGSDSEGEGSDSEVEGSDTGGGNSPSKSNHAESPPKVSPPAKKALEVNLNTSQTLSLPDLDSKDSKEEWKAKWCQDACLLDAILASGGTKRLVRATCNGMSMTKTYDHADPCKEAKCPDQLGPPLDYMTSCGVFKPKKASEYDLCHFYQVGSLGTYQSFPNPVHLQPISR